MTHHPTAIIHPSAQLGQNVKIGAYAIIDAHVEIGDECEVGHHAVIQGPTRMGPENRIFPHACVGMEPQDIGFKDEATRLEMGKRNTVREFVTLHRGTSKDRQCTEIGDDNLFMAYSHVAHDCVIGDHVIMANAATLAGHVSVGDYVNIAGLCAIHQFVRIGAHAMLGGGTMAPLDIPPFTMASGDRAKLFGLNVVGLQRRGFGAEDIRLLKRAYKLLFRSGMTLPDAVAAIAADIPDSPHVAQLLAFVETSQRGITR